MNTQLSLPKDDLFVPDRFEQLNRGGVDLRTIVVPVRNELERLNERIRDMKAARRGSMIVFRGETGSGKSTFLDTVGFFLGGVETVRIPAVENITKALQALSPAAAVRIVVLEGREAIRDVETPVLEEAVHGSIRTYAE